MSVNINRHFFANRFYANAFGSTFSVFPNAQSQTKNCKRATKPTHNYTTMDRQAMTEKEGRTHNSRFAKAGVSCIYDSEVLNSCFVHIMKFSAENPRLRKAAKRWAQYE